MSSGEILPTSSRGPAVRAISRRTLRDFWSDPARPAGTEERLAAWFKAVEDASWHDFAELRQTFGSADVVGNCVVFDVGGNHLRVIGRVFYATDVLPGRVYVLRVMDHEEYDRDLWPDQCGCHEPPPNKAPKPSKPASKPPAHKRRPRR